MRSHRRARHQAFEIRPARQLGSILRPIRILGLPHLHREAVAQVRFFLFLGARASCPLFLFMRARGPRTQETPRLLEQLQKDDVKTLPEDLKGLKS
ncbi:MAG: hypothetical protein EXR99_16060 [Gemmataceae bacterium]|nr:hypothetical protein [Gemmataceae bacterium]